jgi:ATP-dependent helicase YprA (DUF1998 family)
MNALANSQLKELDPIPFTRSVTADICSQDGTGKPGGARAHPRSEPNILFTNFMMLELLMTRQSSLTALSSRTRTDSISLFSTSFTLTEGGRGNAKK